MKRWLVAVAVLLGGAVSFSYADYVLIRAVLGGRRTDGDPNQPGAFPGQPPRGGPPGGPGVPSPGVPSPGAPRGGAPNEDGGGSIPSLGAGQVADIDTAALAVQAVVHIRQKPRVPGLPPTSDVSHKWSAPNHYTRLYNDNEALISRILPMKSLHSRFEDRRHNLKQRTPAALLDLGEYALTHGLVDEFADLFDELARSKEDQTGGSKELRDAVKAYTTVKAALEKAIDRDELAQSWKARLGCRDDSTKHYVLLYTAPVDSPPEVKDWLAMLEHHMKAFYYWWALKGHALPLPDQKLVAVLLDNPDEFRQQRAVVEDEPLVTDGFYANRDHICVFSAQRLDGPFLVFTRQTHPVWQKGFDRAKLLDGTDKRNMRTTTAADFRRYQTLALLERALEDEAQRAAVSHEGSRQLLVASGLLPRTVVPPQWLQFGTAALFETPKGPFPGARFTAQNAYYAGVGAPSWEYLRPFKELIVRLEGRNPTQTGLGPASPAELLKQVVTDGHFNAVLGAKDLPGLYRARTTAWALTYYLAQKRLPGLMRYFQEVAALPRDLEVDGKTLLAAFARAFDVANATQDDIDPAKFEEFAKNWVAFMKGVVTPGVELHLELPDSVTGGQPGQPGGSDGGMPPSGRGGPGGPGGGRGGRPGGG
jgi:hypothetical protein